jgi:glucuronate isomerase
VLNTKNAKEIYEEANRQFKENENLSVTGIMKQFKVYAVGTTDDPADDLAYHKQIASQKEVPATVIPSFRPDKALNIEKETFCAYMESLETVSGKSITLVSDVVAILIDRLDFFVSMGCKASDHALVTAPAVFKSEREVNEIFAKKMNGKCLNHEEVEAYKTFVLTHLAKAYAKRNIAMQLHFAAIRDNNGLMYKKLGPDTGFDASHDKDLAEGLYALLKGCYQDGIPGKMQLGSAWWFADHKDGMEEQMKILGNVGLLPRFIGMLTDSRSFLSYSRHEYFRRILCNILGTWAEEGEVPYDMEMLGKVVENISFGNAKAYFES